MIVHSAVMAPSKPALRRQALARRAALDPATAAAAADVLAVQGVALAARFQAQRIAAYWPRPGEAPTLALLAALAKAGLETALPAVPARAAALAFRRWRPGAPTAPDAHAIPAPPDTAPEVTPDLLFVPLAAFDRSGHRIGYGAGYYDRALEKLRRAGRVPAIGLAFSVQEVERVPAEAHDQRLDFVITERELIACAGP